MKRQLIPRTWWVAISTAMLLQLLGPAPARADDARPARITGVVRDLLGAPIAGASVRVVAVPGGAERTLQTDASGRYTVELAAAGTYSIVVAASGAQASRQVAVASGAQREASFELPLAAGSEVIEVEGMVAPAVPPAPMQDARLTPRYSDAAIIKDAWTRAWLLLDIDRRGVVTRVKLLKSPGYDLDRIAIEHAFALSFTPARDAAGTPVSTYLVWPLEWPSIWWLNAFRMPSIRLPPRDSDPLDPDRPALAKVPCANSGEPLQLDSTYPIYRDCSKPDRARIRRAPWVHPEDLTRTVGGAPIAIDKLALGTLGTAEVAPPEPPRGSRVAPITATAISGGLLVATGLGFWRWSSLQADIRRYQWSNTGAGRAAWSDAIGRAARWRNLTWTGIGATFAGAAVSAFLWNRHDRPLISVSPVERGAGASVTLGGVF